MLDSDQVVRRFTEAGLSVKVCAQRNIWIKLAEGHAQVTRQVGQDRPHRFAPMHVLVGIKVRRVSSHQSPERRQLLLHFRCHRLGILWIRDQIQHISVAVAPYPFPQIDVQPNRERGLSQCQGRCPGRVGPANHETGARHNSALVGLNDPSIDSRAHPEVIGIDDKIALSVHVPSPLYDRSPRRPGLFAALNLDGSRGHDAVDRRQELLQSQRYLIYSKGGQNPGGDSLRGGLDQIEWSLARRRHHTFSDLTIVNSLLDAIASRGPPQIELKFHAHPVTLADSFLGLGHASVGVKFDPGQDNLVHDVRLPLAPPAAYDNTVGIGGIVDAVEEIKDRLPIEDLVGRYVDLKRSGSSYKGLCPFHQEKTPSFYVSPSRRTYHCFGCSRGGDVLSFLMEMERVAFPEALKQLASQAGVTLPERERVAPSLKGKLHEANAAAVAFFRASLDTRAGERARQYLDQRGFGQDAIERFDLGYAPDSWDALLRHLRGAGFDDRVLLAAGLIRQDDAGRTRDGFRNRLMFPICDLSGKVVGFGGRILGDGQPKYLNSPQTEIFDKSSVLYGIHGAQDAVRQAGRAVLVEGYLDAVRAQLAGYEYTVASLGTAVTTSQLTALSRLTDTVIIALDPDPAGQAAAARTSLAALAEVTRARGRASGESGVVNLRIARLPANAGDPDEAIRDHPKVWEEAIEGSIPAFDFYFERVMAGLDRSSNSWRQAAMDQLLPMLQQFAGLPGTAGWQAMWVQRLAAETGIDAGALQRSLPGAQASGSPRPNRRTRASGQEQERQVVAGTTTRALATDPAGDVEKGLMGLLLQMLVLPADATQVLQDLKLEREEHRVILKHLLAWRDSGNYDYEMFRETLPEGIRGEADALHTHSTPLPEDGKFSVAVALYAARLRHLRIVAEVARSTQFLGEISGEDRGPVAASVAELLTERLEIERSLDRLTQLVVQTTSSTPASQGTIDQDSGRL